MTTKHRFVIPATIVGLGSFFLSAYYLVTSGQQDDDNKNKNTNITNTANEKFRIGSNTFFLDIETLSPLSQQTAMTTSCDFFMPRYSLGRRRTIKRMKDSSTKQSLESKYDVQWTRPLGEGGFGAVYLGTNKKTGEFVAIKKISKRFTNDTR